MKNLIVGLVLSVASIVPAFAETASNPVARMQAEMLFPVVQLNRTCSGSIISSEKVDEKVRTLILTAKHCIADASRVQDIYLPVYRDNRIVREELYKAKHVASQTNHDISILELMDTETVLPTVTLAPVNVVLYEGEDTWVVGWPLGHVRTLTTGTFGNRALLDFPGTTRQTEFFRSSPQIAGGNSGGALFHKSPSGHYELIGVTSAYMPQSDFMAYFVPIDIIHDLVGKNLKK